MDNTDTTTPSTSQTQASLSVKPDHTSIPMNDQYDSSHPKYRILTILGVIATIILVGFGSYFLGTQRGSVAISDRPTQSPPPTESPKNEPRTISPSSTQKEPLLGSSNLSYTKIGDEIYLKHTIILTDAKVEFPNSKERNRTKIYTYDDESMEPQERTDIDSAKYAWTSLVEEGVQDRAGSTSIDISDRLFSFKRVPGTDRFVFVIEWERSAEMRKGVHTPYKMGRELYYMNEDGVNNLHKIASFMNDPSQNNYPKIETFSQDNRFVSFALFGCWACGAHQPETLLLDLKTLEMKYVGQLASFSWGQNGTYNYKDYIIIDCKEPQPGECSQDENTLPLKTGLF